MLSRSERNTRRRAEYKARKLAVSSSFGRSSLPVPPTPPAASGRKSIGSLRSDTPPPDPNSCMGCGSPLQFITSTPGTIVIGFASREEEDEPLYLRNKQGGVDTVKQFITKHIPLTRKGRVCPGCVDKLSSVTPEWERNEVLSQINDTFRPARGPVEHVGFTQWSERRNK